MLSYIAELEANVLSGNSAVGSVEPDRLMLSGESGWNIYILPTNVIFSMNYLGFTISTFSAPFIHSLSIY